MATQAPQVAILSPLVVGIAAVLCTIAIHALALGASVDLVRRETRLGRAGASYRADFVIVVTAILIAFSAHLFEIALWAMLFMICGEFTAFAAGIRPLRRQLHDAGLRERRDEPGLAVDGPAGGRGRHAHVRGHDGHDLRCHSAADSRQAS